METEKNKHELRDECRQLKFRYHLDAVAKIRSSLSLCDLACSDTEDF